VFLCLLSFARAKKVRRLPAATGPTAMVQGLSPQLRGLSQVLSTHHKMSKQKNAPQCLARYAATRCRKDERRQCENSV
jgi:hypothetical protein